MIRRALPLAVWRPLASACLLIGLVGPAFSQADQFAIDYPPSIQGSIEYYTFPGDGGDQPMPDRAEYSNTVSSPGTGYSILWECYRIKGYNNLTGTYYNITPQGVYSLSHGWSAGTRSIDLDSPFWAWFGTRTNPQDKYGQFVLRLSYRPSSGSYTRVDTLSWKIRAQDEGAAGSGSSNGSGGGNTGTEVEQGFWSSLFVPSQDCLDDLKDAANDLANWGPFGIYGVISGRIDDNAGSTERVDDDYLIPINIPAGPLQGTYNMDLEPYSLGILFVRFIILGLIMYWFLFVIGAKLYEKI